jgi:hypothetical protein
VTVIVYNPGAAVEAAVIVMVEVPAPGEAIDAGLNETVTPVGWPEAVSATAELNPPETAVVMVLVPFAPCATETEPGEAEMVNAGAVTVRDTVAVWVIPPPVPVTVIVYRPAAAVEAAAIVIVEVPEPGDAIDVGLNETVTPAGWPDAVSATADLNPFETVVVMVLVPLAPWATVTEAGEAEMVNTGAGIVRDTVAVCVIPPPVPVTVIVYSPAAVVEAAAIVIVEAPEPGEAIDAGLNETVTPAGWPEAVRATAELNPPETAVVMVLVPFAPGATVAEAGEAEMVKFAEVAVPESAAIRPAPAGLPQPVTRSYPVTAE